MTVSRILPRSRPGRCRRRVPPRPGATRRPTTASRPRPRSASTATATATATASRSTAPRARPARASLEADPRLLLPGHAPGPARGTDQGAHHRRQEGRRGRRPRRAPAHAAWPGARPSPGKVRPRATRWRIMPRGSTERGVLRAPAAAGLAEVDGPFPGAAEFSAGNRPTTLRLPGHATAPLPRRAAIGREAHGQRAAARPLRAGRRPTRGPGGVAGEAVRAQAVAARTYAAYERARRGVYYDICDTDSCQVYGGVAAEHPAATAAVKATRGRVVLYEGQPAFTQFSSSNGGYSLGRVAALPGRPARSLRGGLGQPATTPGRPRHRAARSRRRGPGSATSSMSFSPGRPRRTSAAGSPRSRSPAAAGLHSVKVTGDDFRFRLGLRSTGSS